MQEFTGLYKTIWNKAEPYRTIPEYTGLNLTRQYMTIQDYARLYRTIKYYTGL